MGRTGAGVSIAVLVKQIIMWHEAKQKMHKWFLTMKVALDSYERFRSVRLLMTEFDCPEVMLRGWQNVKNLIIN